MQEIERLERYQYIAGFEDATPPDQGGGCACSGACDDACPCCAAYPWGRLHDARGILTPVALGLDVDSTLIECGPGCACRGRCNPPQSRTPARASLEWVPGQGWGAVASDPIPAGTFICEYVGERLSNTEAEARLERYQLNAESHALLIFREILPSSRTCIRINVDATSKGNIAAFINHRLRIVLGGLGLEGSCEFATSLKARLMKPRAGALVPFPSPHPN